jgi:hypothetical protein
VTPDGPVLHPELAALEFLIGNWRGRGSGSYSGSQRFDYEEELTFTHVGKPVLAYSMRTRLSPGGSGSHSEQGFWRCRDLSRLDCVASHATGHVEVSSGSVVGSAVQLSSTSILAWPGAKEVVALGRRLHLAGDVLTDQLEMQAVGQMRQAHVVAELRRA